MLKSITRSIVLGESLLKNIGNDVTRSLATGNYGGRQTVTLIPGDGVGPELMAGVKKVFNSASVPVDFEEIVVKQAESTEATCYEALTAIQRNGVALKGNLDTDLDLLEDTELSPNVYLRTQLDLFANVIKVKSIPAVPTRHNNIDIRIIRENTEGEYANLEHESIPGVVETYKIITADASTRIAKFAFEYARRNRRKKVTAVHKANIMKLADGLFLQCCKDVSKDFPDIEFDSMIVDNTAMQLVSNPGQFDVMVTPNLYGNIIGNICTGLVGGAGVVAGANIGLEQRVFETATRNTGKDIVGMNVANPSGMLFASTLMLKYLGLKNHASMINQAIIDTIDQDSVLTPDLGGCNTTTDVIDSICAKLEATCVPVRL